MSCPPLARAALLLWLLSALLPSAAAALVDPPTVGLEVYDTSKSYFGYTLFTPLRSTETYLIDNGGREIHSWSGNYEAGASVYLLDDGSVLRAGNIMTNPVFAAGGQGGVIEKIAWDGTLEWQFEYSTTTYLHHHDIEPLPNGNVLLVAWEYRSMAEAIQAGRDPAQLPDGELWPDTVVEIEPSGMTGGSVVWIWRAWDHLIQDFDNTKDNFGVVGDHPELLDINHLRGAGADWMHVNGMDYNADLDQIVISAHGTDEIYVIDHSTSTSEAAGHTGGNSGMGGDILYRWGNPEAYDAGTAGDQQLFLQHDAHWIGPGLVGAGNILVFNNGSGRPGGNYSSVDELVTPVDMSGNYSLTGSAYDPTAPVWSYTDPVDPLDFYASFISGARRLPNGNTLICNGPAGTFFEVTDAGETVWRYVNPVINTGPLAQGDAIPGPVIPANLTFRAERYAPDFEGFDGRDLSGGPPIELYPDYGDFDEDADVDADDASDFIDCYTTGGVVFPVCVQADFDSDGAITCDDWASFATAFTGPGDLPVLQECINLVPTLPAWGAPGLALLLTAAGALVLRRSARATPGG